MPEPKTKRRPPKARPRTHAEINVFRRRALMEGTIASLARHGVGGTTVQTITEEAGVSRGLIGHYFASKDELIAEAFRHLFTEVGGKVAQEAARRGRERATARLLAFPEALFSPKVFTPRNRHAFLSFWHEVRFNDLVRKANRELYRDYIERMTDLFARAAAEQGVTIDARASALGLVALTDGLWLGLSIHDRVMSSAQATDLCQAYLRDRLELAGPISDQAALRP